MTFDLIVQTRTEPVALGATAGGTGSEHLAAPWALGPTFGSGSTMRLWSG